MKALRSAYLKGMQARVLGHAISDCPYDDKRKPCGRLTWSRAFIAAWRDGWLSADTNREQALITLAYSGSGRSHQS